MNKIKEFILRKVVLRVVYIVAAFTVAHFVALVGSPSVQAVLAQAGLVVQITDKAALETFVTGLLLVAGEFLFHLGHGKALKAGVFEKKSDGGTP